MVSAVPDPAALLKEEVGEEEVAVVRLATLYLYSDLEPNLKIILPR